MNIDIIEHAKDLRVTIQCRQVDDQVNRLKSHIELFDNKLQAKMENEFCFVNAIDVLYFESVDNRIFLYTEDRVMANNCMYHENMSNHSALCYPYRREYL